MEIEGVAAFVTGGSGGLGAVIAAKLAEAGADVAVGYRGGRERAERTAESVQALGRKAALIQLDQNDASSVAAAVEEVARA